jgi:periplasmic protein TonB
MGTVKVETIIDTKGNFEGLRVVQGMPLGLNERTLETMRTWRCSPATKDGNPVSMVVMFQVDFRLY